MPFAGTVAHRHRAKWRWDDIENTFENRAYLLRRLADGGQCVMHTSTNRRCVKTYFHRLRHSTRPEHRGKAA